MEYVVTNTSISDYIGIIKIKKGETVKVDKKVYDYLEQTFGRYNIFTFKVLGVTKSRRATKKTKEGVSKTNKTSKKE